MSAKIAIKFFLRIFVLLTIVACEHQYDLGSKYIDDKEIEQVMREYKVPGLSVAIIEDGSIISLKTYGLKNSTTFNFIDENTRFEAASLSKPVFAYGVLKMVEHGQIDLDIPISDYFQFTDVKDIPMLNQITIRMILNHTTGFPNLLHKNSNDLKIHFQPGDKFSYSGVGFTYLQKIVEKLSNQTLEQYMQKNVFIPLNMTHSSFVCQKECNSAKASGHDIEGLPIKTQEDQQANAAFTLHTTVLDYAKFVQAVIQNNGLQEKIINEMLTSQIKVGDDGPLCIDECSSNLSQSISWGLGVGLQNTINGKSFWHWGDNDGFQSYVAGFKNGRSIVIFTNSDNGMKAIPIIIYKITGISHPAFNWLNYK